MRILVFTPRPLYPADTGGLIRSSKIFERLSQEHAVTLLCFRTGHERADDLDLMRASCTRLEMVSWSETPKYGARFYFELALGLGTPLPYTVSKYRSAAMRARIQSLLSSGEYDLLVCDFLQPSINCLDLPFRPKVLFQHNVEAMIRQRQLQHTRNPIARAYLSIDARKLARYERLAAHAFDHCIMVSDEDCEAMAREYGATNTSAIPSGVDTEYFAPGQAEGREPQVVFVGSMDVKANQDAVTFFANDILPLVRQEVPATFVIVGRNPPTWMQRMNGTTGVKVLGTVPDVRPHVARAHVAIVPLRFGGGTRIKILEAMAMGKPVVSTSIGAEGLPVTDGRDICLADDPRAFADALISLLGRPEERKRLGVAGRVTSERYSWTAAAQEFSRICVNVARQSGTGS